MPSPIVNRLKKIEYQISKEYDIANFDDPTLIYFAQGIINAIINEGTVISDADMPTEMFGVTIDWSQGVANDTIVKLTKGSVEVIQDLAEANVNIPSLDETAQQAYILAISLVSEINGDDGLKDEGYVFTTNSQALIDAEALIDTIN